MPRFELSERLVLRPLEEADASDLYELTDENRSYLARWMPWAAEQTLEGTREFIRSTLEQEDSGDGFQVALITAGRISGMLSLHEINRNHLLAGVGYWLAEPDQGRGLMSRAVRALVDHAFGELALHRVEIRTTPENARSRTLCERLGFVEEGVLRQAERIGDRYRDRVLYSMLAPDWPGER